MQMLVRAETLQTLINKRILIAKSLVALAAILTVVLTLSCSGGDSLPDAVDFSFTLYQGEDVLGASTLRLSDLSDKPTVVNFWAGLCPPCREEMPHFQEFYDEFEGRINFVGVDAGQFTNLGSAEDAKDLLRDLGVTYPAGFTEDGDAVREYVISMPTTVFVTTGSKVFRSWAGYLSKGDLTEITEEMLASEA